MERNNVLKSKQVEYCDVAVNTDLTCQDIQTLEKELLEANEKLQKPESAYQKSEEKQFLKLKNIQDDDTKSNFTQVFCHSRC